MCPARSLLCVVAIGGAALVTGCSRTPEPDSRLTGRSTYQLDLPAEVAARHQLPARCTGELRSDYRVAVVPGTGRSRYTGRLALVALRPEGGEVELEAREVDGEVEGSTADAIATVAREGQALVAKYRSTVHPK